MPYGDDTSSSENVTHLNFNVLEKLQCYERSHYHHCLIYLIIIITIIL